MNELQQIIALLNNNDFDSAIKACQHALQQTPNSAELYNTLGIIAAQTNDLIHSVTNFKQAIALEPTNAVYYNNLSNALKKQGQLSLARQYLQQALTLAPNYAEAYNNLGSLYYTEGRIKEAIPYFEKAIRLSTAYWEPHYNLANCLIKEDQTIKAISHYQTVLKIKPAHLAAKQNLAMAYVAVKQLQDALPYLEEIAQYNPTHAEIQAQLAEAYLDTGNTSLAIQTFEKALQLLPSNAVWQHNLAVLYLREQQPAQALLHFKAALQANPDNPTAQHMVQALSNLDSKTAPPQYIADLFDQYSAYYDQHVKKQLQYQAPELLRQIISKHLGNALNPMNILDLGCGTGLCSVYFRDLAKYLIGIDLSAEMLAHAKALNSYDALCQGNICQCIPGTNSNCFDLIIAADVLVYCGDLTNIFALCATALKNTGLLAFTIEKLAIGDYHLQTTGRFAHSLQYIAAIAQQSGFIVQDHREIQLRMQQDKPIIGELYLLSKNNASL